MSKISCVSFIHGRETISEFGPWSWAPKEIHDIPVESESGEMNVEGFGFGFLTGHLNVSEDGTASGGMSCRLLKEEDACGNITPAREACDQTALRIQEALVEWENCLILREPIRGEGDALLAVLVGHKKMPVTGALDDMNVLDCLYVGAISLKNDTFTLGSIIEGEYEPFPVRFGKDEGRSGLPAEALLSLLESEDEYGDSDDADDD
ncbi:hypothetical protein ABW20_dc0102893 [Dactylellina cionopaga]|nr:hypothetical protein ABW20_dc0102893 [Dactylellina cionopaga]